MKFCILMGSPRINGNTVSLTAPFADELERHGVEVEIINLYDKNIKPCTACRVCQNFTDQFGCAQNDDMQHIFHSILKADCFILSTPIYSWYCTPPMKAMLDRLVYGMNKYYGNLPEKISLWQGKKCGIITTCGYKVEKGTDLFEQGIIRYCKHSKLDYVGMLAERDMGYNTTFISDCKIGHAKMFAKQLIDICNNA